MVEMWLHGPAGSPEDQFNRTWAMIEAWRDNAVADGWEIQPTFGEIEPVERAFTLTREDFKVTGILRGPNEHGVSNCSLHGWGPPGRPRLAFLIPQSYGWMRCRPRPGPACVAEALMSTWCAPASASVSANRAPRRRARSIGPAFGGE